MRIPAALVVVSLLALVGCDEAADPGPLPPCPPRMVHLPELDFCIDRYEAVLDRVGASARAVSAEGRLPEVDITWSEARSACEQSGYRLCTQAEWHFACAGAPLDAEGGRAYPYGDSFEAGRCNSTSDGEDVQQDVFVGGARAECQTPEGVFDLSGNVSEWIEDEQTGMRGIRGGNFSSYERYAACVVTPSPFQDPNTHTAALGFRCCADAR